MRDLWTFASREKLDKFVAIMERHGLAFETTPADGKKFVMRVEESDYPKAKRILLKHRERRTSGDSINSHDPEA